MSEQVKNGKSKNGASLADHVRKIDAGLDEVKQGIHNLADYVEYVESEVIKTQTDVAGIQDRFRQMDDGYDLGNQ